MPHLSESFDAVADWCERHMETTRGREVGMTFSAAIRAYGRLATMPTHLLDDHEALEQRALNEKTDELMLDFCTRFLVAYGWHEDKAKRLADVSMQSTNMAYDPGPQH